MLFVVRGDVGLTVSNVMLNFSPLPTKIPVKSTLETMMSKQEQGAGARGISELIAWLSSNRASGSLKIVAGTTEGELLFNGGNLVDARLGHLAGFPAVNAIASMHDAHVEFDPSIDTPTTSSMTSNEQVVLKQFFGIDAVDSTHDPRPAITDEDETTVITTKAPPATRTEAPPRYRTRYRSRRSRLRDRQSTRLNSSHLV